MNNILNLGSRDRHDHPVGDGPSVCLGQPPKIPEVHEILAVDEADDPEELESSEGVVKENFPGSHLLSLEALVKRAHDGLGHPGRDSFLRILKNSLHSQQTGSHRCQELEVLSVREVQGAQALQSRRTTERNRTE